MTILAVAVGGLALLVAGSLSGNRWPLWSRALLAASGVWLGFAVWQAAVPSGGWATHAKPPRQAAFLWGVIHEPDPTTHDPGTICLWLAEPQPRAHCLPYTRLLHRKVQTAVDAVKHGQRVGVKTVAHPRSGAAGDSHGGRYVFYKLPPPRLPTKLH